MNILIIINSWNNFWFKLGRCPVCFTRFFSFNDTSNPFSYCPNHIEQAYYENGDKVRFAD